MAEAASLAGALDEAGHVGGDEGLAARCARDAEVGDERGEGVVGDLGARGADARDDGALPHRRHANEGGVGHELHLELDPVLAGRLALLGKRRGAAHRGDKVDVAAAAGASRRHDDALAGTGEVGDVVGGRLRLGVELADDRAHGDAQHEVGAVAAVATRALPVRAALGAEVVLVAVVDERRELRVGLDDDAAAATAVAAVGTALGNECLAAEGHAAGAAVAAADVDVGKVGERVLHVSLLWSSLHGTATARTRPTSRLRAAPAARTQIIICVRLRHK